MLNKNTLKTHETAISPKIVKFKGVTEAMILPDGKVGHRHQFVIYEDDTVEIFDFIRKDPQTGEITKHTHTYEGEYPHGYMLEEPYNGSQHKHKISSVSHPITIKKRVYSSKSVNKVIDKSFSEFHKSSKSEEVDLKKFWKDHEKAFYSIPKEGATDSHEYLIKSSLDYYSNYQDERDEEIIELTERIVELEQELAEADDLNKEHPIFKNGTFLKQPDDKSVYYMDQGRKRKIKKWDTYLILKRTQGHLEETPDEEVYILVTEDVIKGIPSGPEFQNEDLYGDEEERKQAEDRKIIKLDPDDFIADPTKYPTVSEYIAALDRETRQLLAKEEYLEGLRYRYQRDLGARGDVALTPEEKISAESRLGEVTPQLLETRRKIVRYTKILEKVDPDGDLKNLEIDTSQLKNIVTGEMDKKVTSTERNKLIGKNLIDRYINKVDKGEKSKTKSSSMPSSPGGMSAGQAAGLAGISAPGLSGLAGEPQPKSPPAGFKPNPNNLLKNDSIGEAGSLMRLGVSSPKGDWNWGLKYVKGTNDTPKLENSAYKRWANWNPIGVGVGGINPHTKPISRYFWSLSRFEWIPKAGTFGIKHRYWHGKKIDSMR